VSTKIELRTYITHPAVPQAKMLFVELTLPQVPPLGCYISWGRLAYMIHTLTWFHDEQLWVSSQQMQLDVTDNYQEHLDELLEAGWKPREMAS